MEQEHGAMEDDAALLLQEQWHFELILGWNYLAEGREAVRFRRMAKCHVVEEPSESVRCITGFQQYLFP